MKNRDFVLWLGGVFSEEAMLTNRAISPAANRWQVEILRALTQAGMSVVVLGQKYEQRWPLGALRPGDLEDAPDNIDVVFSKYWNLPFGRNRSLAMAFRKTFEQLVREKGNPPQLIITYNPYYQHGSLARYAYRRYGIPWIPIVADFKSPGEEWADYKRETAEAMGHVFLSYWAYKECPLYPKLHIDSGVANLRVCEKSYRDPEKGKPFVFLYTGAVSRFKGIDLLLDAFEIFLSTQGNQHAELWICGKLALRGEGVHLQHRFDANERIKYFGVVPEGQLEEFSMRADAFVNPRPTGIQDHMMNFPSKLLEYLSYGKPVISTMTPGVAPEFADILYTPDGEDSAAFAKTMAFVSSLHRSELDYLRSKTFEFLKETRLWSVQAEKLVQWLNSNGLEVPMMNL